MSNAPKLLNDDGTASMATALLMSHHGLRRDVSRFATALERVAEGDSSKIQDLREEWQRYRETLHGHHEAEDARLFPHIRSQSELLGPTIDELTSDHRRIDPLLERGDRAFAELPRTEAARAVIAELTEMLDVHLAREELSVIPMLRDAKGFPPMSEEEADVYAAGFAWSSQGIAPEVLARVDVMLPESLKSRLPSARAAFDARCERVWGSRAAGASHTAIPGR